MQSASKFRVLMFVLPILAGIGAGVVSSVLLAPKAVSGAPAPARVELRDKAATLPERTLVSRPQDDGSAVAQRIAALEREVDALSNRPEPEAEALSEADRAARLEADRRVASEEFRAKLSRYQGEATDVAWAGTARASIQTGMTAISGAETESTIDGVDCRSTSCLATVSFPSYEAARLDFARYVTAWYDVPCASTAVLDEPEDPTAPYAVQILFEHCRQL